MMTLKDVALKEIDFISKSEYILSIDNSCGDILLFTQSANCSLSIYNASTKARLTQINSLDCRLISAKVCKQNDEFLLTPSFSAGQILLYKKTGETQTIVPKINCNKGHLRSAHFLGDRIYYVFPNNIINTDLGGYGYSDFKTSAKDMYIDTYFNENFSVTILRQNNNYCLDICENGSSQNVKALEAGFIPSSVTLMLNSKEELLEPYILATRQGKSFVIHYKFSYK